MKKKDFFVFLVLSAMVSIGGCSHTSKYSQIPLPLIEVPEGFQWELNQTYSDEFNGGCLDRDKWHDTYPGWEGRVPGKFAPSSVSVKDGFLRIQSTVLDPPLGDEDQWTIACGAIQSKAQQALYGYYEVCMKASSVSTSSTFWLMSPQNKKKRPSKRTELDIIECIGNAKRWPSFRTHMHSNTHVTIFPADKDAEPLVAKKGNDIKIDTSVDEAFHTYGCWWVNANTMKFYLDGKYVYSINPPTDFDETPFDLPMFVNLVCEIYDWEVPPTEEELMDDSRNTTLYDYVRAYKLVKVDNSK